MATVKELKATARPKAGKGAARAERRAGRVPAVIYGDNQPPLTISLDDKMLRQNIFAGHFLTTLFNIDLDGKKHRVIPRDYSLDPVKDFPLHVDFLRLGQGATIRVSVPLHVSGTEVSPGVKRGGTVNIVNHTVELEADVEHIPQFIEVDVSKLEINNSIHLSDVALPKGVKAVSRDDQTLVTVVPPSGYGEEAKAAGGAEGAAAGAAPAAGAAAPAAGAKAPAAAAKAPAAKAPAAGDKKK
ncbi:50S ribosomal protein L25/general stress protein Ctc [Bradyrhizobium sp. SYSU BS000235]|uniref:50S ribosomal protein L25/general stress protein Ctc n=1 Tax=Bradyrhizobium sp. SYSU BS000235 TaxID=3411332 RepID=UPI003C7083A6